MADEGEARGAMPGIRAWLKERAREAGEDVKYTVGVLEIMLIAEKVDIMLEKWLERYDFIYEGARQGGHLAYLPDLELGKLVKVEDAAKSWKPQAAEDKSNVVPHIGSSKLDAEWLKNRYDWLDKDGVPMKPDYGKMDLAGAEKIEEMQKARAESYAEEEEKGAILVTAEEQEIFDEHAVLLQSHPAVRKKIYTERLKAFTDAVAQTPAGKKKAAAQAAAKAAGKVHKQDVKEQKKSQKIQVAKLQANEEWRTPCSTWRKGTQLEILQTGWS